MIMVKRFTAAWCGPCRQLAPLFTTLENEFPNVEFQTIDVDTSREEVQEHFITSVPTVIFFKDGVAKHRTRWIAKARTIAAPTNKTK